MQAKSLLKYLSVPIVATVGLVAAAPAQSPQLELLSKLQRGEWTVKPRGVENGERKVCLGDPALLLQIQHGGASCSRYVIEDTPRNLRVSYKCGSADHGVTSIKFESSGLVQIHSQGIEDNAPFSFTAEGRRTGSC